MKTTILIGVSFFALIGFYVVEIPHFGHYLELGLFFSRAMLFALVFAALLMVYFIPKIKGKTLDKVQIGLAILFTCLFLSPLLVSWTNRWLHPIETISVEFIKEEARLSGIVVKPKQEVSPDSYHLYFYWQNQAFKINTAAPHFPNAVEGQNIEIPVNFGRWHLPLVAF